MSLYGRDRGNEYTIPKVQQLDLIEEVVAGHPDVRFVVDHMAWTDETVTCGDDQWS